MRGRIVLCAVVLASLGAAPTARALDARVNAPQLGQAGRNVWVPQIAPGAAAQPDAPPAPPAPAPQPPVAAQIAFDLSTLAPLGPLVLPTVRDGLIGSIGAAGPGR
jgi:hypothetical protein